VQFRIVDVSFTPTPTSKSRDQSNMSSLSTFLTDNDRIFLEQQGISVEEATRQWALLNHPPQPVDLVRPCTIGDGIEQIASQARGELIAAHRQAAERGRWCKFVPASGAASRMFSFSSEEEEQRFCESIERFAFAERLREHLAADDVELSDLQRTGGYREVVDAVLGPDGLGYGELAKGLIEFHRYQHETRTPFDEHLLEGHTCFGDGGGGEHGAAAVHFTIALEHQALFTARLNRFQKQYMQARVSVQFSAQRSSTDTIAMGDRGEISRTDDASPLLRPGGHGALIDNLNDLGADLIFVKNVDNVGHAHVQEVSAIWIQILGGYLVRMRDRVNELLRSLDAGKNEGLVAALKFVQKHFADSTIPAGTDRAALREFLAARLNRPLRVCGMVRNAGEPGGGPFWVRQDGGDASVQIVEKAEVDLNDQGELDVMKQASHFNPVFMALAIRDAYDRPYDLHRFVNQSRTMITQKPVDGRATTVLERPGLWNGGMADWNTIFVEVPIEVFSPVKSVFDLLRAEHQPM
jgi:hypothetical protein